jgi:hypothetical protein
VSEDLRIGHRGLEHRQDDDTYWLNGTRIDDVVYNQEIQRIIAHENGRRTAEQLQHEAIQNTKRQQQLWSQKRDREREHQAKMAAGAMINADFWHTPGIVPSKVREAMGVLQQSAPPTVRKLNVQSSPLFRHLRWRFDSPFAPLRQWLVRWVWQYQRRQVRAS